MSLHIVIPVKPFGEGKSRLGGVLAPAQREALSRAFFRHTLGVASAVVPPADVLVVSSSDEVRALATGQGASAFAETGRGGLNAALEQAAQHLEQMGGQAMLALSSDLPCLSTSDLRAMLARHPADCTEILACDRVQSGTNARLVRLAARGTFLHGSGSLAAYKAAALKRGCPAQIIHRPGLAFDIDAPADLQDWAGLAEPVIDPSVWSSPARITPPPSSPAP